MSSLSPSKGSHGRMLVMVVPALLLLRLAVRSFVRKYGPLQDVQDVIHLLWRLPWSVC